jgi:HEAT repeat protein
MIENPDVAKHIDRLRLRAGSPPDLRERGRALAWLLDHADAAFPVALRRAEAEPGDAVLLDLLGRFRRAEATPLLLRAFADARTRLVAASGLGMSPDPGAHAALRRALDSSDPGEVFAALSGIGAGGDTAFCPDVRRQLGAADTDVRWTAVEVGARLGCLEEGELAALSADDPDADIRALAAAKLRRSPPE